MPAGRNRLGRRRPDHRPGAHAPRPRARLAVLVPLALAAALAGAVLGSRAGEDRAAERTARAGGGGAARETGRAPAGPRRGAGRSRKPGRQRVPPVVAAHAARLDLDAQVAQLLLVGFRGTTLTDPFFEELARRGWGGVLLGEANFESIEQLAALAGELGVVARGAGHPAPLVAAAQEGGTASALPQLPPAAQPDLAAQGAGAVRDAAREAATRLRDANFSMVLAPVADVDAAAGPMTDRAFGDDPAKVARLARAAVDGWRQGGLLPVVKHFPGQGAASQDPLDGPATVSLRAGDLRSRDLPPFRAVARRAAGMVVSSATYLAFDPVSPAVATPAIVRELLRDELGFRGIAVSDDLAGAAAVIGGGVERAAVAALEAGADLLQVPDPSEADRAHRAVVAAVRAGRIPRARVREAVLRVLGTKARAGLLERPAPPAD